MLDIIRLCREKRIPFLESGHHHAHQGWVQLHCPFCTDGNHGWHLGFSLHRGNLNCWRCGSHSAWDWLNRVLRASDRSTVAQVMAEYDNGRRSLPDKLKARKRSIQPPLNSGPMTEVHRRYLRSRGFIPEKLEREWGLMGTSHLSGEWNWRVVAPVHNGLGEIVAYTGRSIDPEVRPKYKTTDNEDMLVDPKSLVYGLHKVRDSVLVVEGPADAWRMGPGAVSLLGIDWKLEQALQLKQFKRKFIAFDPEPEAQKRAEELAEWLGLYGGEVEIIDGLGSDPGDLPQGEADKLMKELGIH